MVFYGLFSFRQALQIFEYTSNNFSPFVSFFFRITAKISYQIEYYSIPPKNLFSQFCFLFLFHFHSFLWASIYHGKMGKTNRKNQRLTRNSSTTCTDCQGKKSYQLIFMDVKLDVNLIIGIVIF